MFFNINRLFIASDFLYFFIILIANVKNICNVIGREKNSLNIVLFVKNKTTFEFRSRKNGNLLLIKNKLINWKLFI